LGGWLVRSSFVELAAAADLELLAVHRPPIAVLPQARRSTLPPSTTSDPPATGPPTRRRIPANVANETGWWGS